MLSVQPVAIVLFQDQLFVGDFSDSGTVPFEPGLTRKTTDQLLDFLRGINLKKTRLYEFLYRGT